jgi:hypothetical protein
MIKARIGTAIKASPNPIAERTSEDDELTRSDEFHALRYDALKYGE